MVTAARGRGGVDMGVDASVCFSSKTTFTLKLGESISWAAFRRLSNEYMYHCFLWGDSFNGRYAPGGIAAVSCAQQLLFYDNLCR